MRDTAFDPVNRPKHYNAHPTGIQPIDFAWAFDSLTQQAVQYVWRAKLKGSELEDLKKARFFLQEALATDDDVFGDTFSVGPGALSALMPVILTDPPSLLTRVLVALCCDVEMVPFANRPTHHRREGVDVDARLNRAIGLLDVAISNLENGGAA